MLLDVLLAGIAVLHLVALPVLLIALADNEQRADRLRFGIAFLIAVLATAAIVMLDREETPRYDPADYPHFKFPFVPLVVNLLWLCTYAWFGRVTVRRLNDIGRPKKRAFLLLLPYVDFGFATFLLFVRPRRTDRPSTVAE